jgi:glucuronate isomerase
MISIQRHPLPFSEALHSFHLTLCTLYSPFAFRLCNHGVKVRAKKDTFITENFLLETRTARRLYHGYAEGMPIIDYHCHLSPEQIASDRRWDNLSQIWLSGDHYKWRAMRANGVPERFCSGKADDWDKFRKWAETMPYLLRNPLYHWTHMELKRYFGISDRLLGPDTARSIWDECNRKLARPGFSARGIMKQSNVVLVCTTDDPVDSLEHHRVIAKDKSFGIKVLPAWRPDRAMAVENVKRFNEWVNKLSEVADIDIRDFSSFMRALRRRHEFFNRNGCRLSDHGLETAYAGNWTEKGIKTIFRKLRNGKNIGQDESFAFKSAMLHELGVMDHESGWTQQFHFGALRNNNTRMFRALGPDTGFDSIGDFNIANSLSRFLDRLDSANQLARTILYNINPRDNALMATMAGNFQDGAVPGKVQYGSAWWFLDQKDGMEQQIEVLSQMGLLGMFVGMTTDSRSFLSYARHDYFRRILCNIVGADVEKGVIPNDMELAGRLIRDVCYNNAARYFQFNVPKA